jgi:hypothetical protein
VNIASQPQKPWFKNGVRPWLSADPIGEVGGLNLYGYVGGNPVNLSDPLGLWTWQDTKETGAALLNREAYKLWTRDEVGHSLRLGAMATADGFIPGKDPFKEAGKYSGCEDGAQFSNAMGGVAREAAMLATGAKVYQAIGAGILSSSGVGGASALQQSIVGRAEVDVLIGRQAFVETYGRVGPALHSLMQVSKAYLASELGVGIIERIKEGRDLINGSSKDCN